MRAVDFPSPGSRRCIDIEFPEARFEGTLKLVNEFSITVEKILRPMGEYGALRSVPGLEQHLEDAMLLGLRNDRSEQVQWSRPGLHCLQLQFRGVLPIDGAPHAATGKSAITTHCETRFPFRT